MADVVKCARCGAAFDEKEHPQVEVRKVHMRVTGVYPFEARDVSTFAAVYCSFRCAGPALMELDEYGEPAPAATPEGGEPSEVREDPSWGGED